MSASLLQSLGLSATNSGTYLGQGQWSDATGAGVLRPANPTTATTANAPWHKTWPR